ncbi:hypothetical protein [Cryobacterium sp. PH31-O1]|uniref:hypothetical protein n=1 Tax=Cryobacterium sp. PH31-O1 TaxID=3046306 RepID=UPI0024BAC5EE|nr:hypothetical protein [Cryobacterium sp. PH31-O1]MDJ0337425.1 hypothetical protein [Cryobacterium sp. PH31-O1]
MTDFKAAAKARIAYYLNHPESILNTDADHFAFAQATATMAIAEAADAQVAATIAQTEQLRIGNLIAYKQLHTPREVNDRGLFFELPVDRDEMTSDIERGLWAL